MNVPDCSVRVVHLLGAAVALCSLCAGHEHCIQSAPLACMQIIASTSDRTQTVPSFMRRGIDGAMLSNHMHHIAAHYCPAPRHLGSSDCHHPTLRPHHNPDDGAAA